MKTKETIVLKIGGSVLTYKNVSGLRIRKKQLRQVAKEVKQALNNNPKLQLIIVHGAGSAGHHLAKRFDLVEGVRGDSKKLKAALQIRHNNQALNSAVTEAFLHEGVNVSPVHTASAVIQKQGKLESVAYDQVDSCVKNSIIPIMYGEMVFDKTLGMSVCSGDVLVSQLAEKFKAKRILFATDVDGIFDTDPYKDKKAKLIEQISFKELFSNKEIKLGESHNVDVTGGLLGKIIKLKDVTKKSHIKEIRILNGIKSVQLKKALEGGKTGTVIK